MWLTTTYKKSVRVSLVAYLTNGSSGIALIVETSNAEAHADMNIPIYNNIGIYYIPMDVFVALLFDN